MRAVGRALLRVLRAEPTLLASALRLTLIVVLGVGFDVQEATLAAAWAVVEVWFAVVQRALVTPEAEVVRRVKRAEEHAERDVVAYLSGVEARRRKR